VIPCTDCPLHCRVQRGWNAALTLIVLLMAFYMVVR
jgi:hypothetical protein